MVKKILIATSNPAKIKEYKELLRKFPFKVLTIKDLKIEQKIKEKGKNFKENAISKAKFYAKISGLPTIADDGGLEIDYLKGEPGVKSRRWPGYEASDEELINMTLQKLKGVKWKERKAQFRTVIALAIPNKGVFTSEGKLRGIILTKPQGKLIPGYPFRSLFYLPKYKKTLAQLNFKEAVKIGHRKKALKKLIPIFKKFL